MLGIHYHSKNNLLHGEYKKFKCVQIFRSSAPPDDIDAIIYVHAPYTLNVWKTKNKPDFDQGRAFGYFTSEVKKCRAYAVGYIMHLPSGENIPDLMEIARTTKILLMILKKLTGGKLKLLLEMPAAKNGKFETPEKINALVAAVNGGKNFGICVDTAHLWGMGEDISSYDSAKLWFDKLNYPQAIGMIHLNGSSVEFNCGMDVHEIAFSSTDKIWHKVNYEESGLFYIVEFSRKYKIPIILEINRGTLPDFKKLINNLTKKSKLTLASPPLALSSSAPAQSPLALSSPRPPRQSSAQSPPRQSK
jgi:endonuclease IV